MTNLTEITSDAQFNDLASKKDAVYVLNFWASWAEPCQQMNEVFAELAGKFPALQFLKVHIDLLWLLFFSSTKNDFVRLKLKNTQTFLRVSRSRLCLHLSFSR
jgi:thiol-disulfide isomerase/thioredoxin